MTDKEVWIVALAYGSDGCSSTLPSCTGTSFYIAEIGWGVASGSAPCGGGACNSGLGTTVGSSHTFTYWWVGGPKVSGATNASQAYTWGQEQGNNYWLAWNNGPQRNILFLDIENGTTCANADGWYVSGNSAQTTLNREVLLGAINALQARGGVKIGVYSSNYEWGSIMGSYSTPSGVAYTWVANSTGAVCPTSLAGGQFGGTTPGIWQYDDTSSYDYDVADTTIFPA